ncbi:MAG TPA: amino acid adenylation domain-containing protein, partial [Polyangiaceae bacterium]|nr:amino acid adenylation domain-containing protein [Polyangiaceae bacterium]
AVVWRLDGDTIFGPRVTADDVARLTARVEALIERAVASPSAPLAELLAVPERERRELLAWGRGAAVGAPSGTAADDVRRSARATPGAPALAAGGEVLDYASLDRRVDAFAAGLLGRGVGRGSRVAVALERGVDLVAAMLAAWRVGAAYVPIDLAHPAERVARLLDDASCALLVHGGGASASACARWNVEDEPPPAVARPSRPDEAGLGGEIAYIIYTSGSTGRPKGVEVEHAALRNTIRAKVELVAMRPGDTQLAVMSAAFDASIFELTMPLLAGARLVVATRGELEDFAALAATAGRVGASVVGATPHTWRGLLEAGWRPPAGLRALVGGEALPPDLGARLASFCRVFNMYGLTETAISSTYFEVGAGLAGEGVPIGRPLPNVLTRVVGPLGGLSRVGEAGELYVGGLGLARGYRGGEALTRERFVADPAGETGARFFRTGDRARVRRDGQLEYLGRLDAQVKVRGARVELGEVEAALADAPGVAAAVADVRELGGAPCIVAYVVARGGALAEADLRALAGRRLPPHMVPSAFVTIDRVPLTPNGKVDRTALPPPPAPAPASAAEGAAPGGGADDPLAAAVREAFAAVLGPGCDLGLDFAALGLDSIGRSRVRQALGRRGVEVALVDLFERRGAAELIA